MTTESFSSTWLVSRCCAKSARSGVEKSQMWQHIVSAFVSMSTSSSESLLLAREYGSPMTNGVLSTIVASESDCDFWRLRFWCDRNMATWRSAPFEVDFRAVPERRVYPQIPKDSFRSI